MIAVLVEENKALKESLNKCEGELDLRRAETKIYRNLLERVGIVKRGQHPRNEEDARVIFNSFLQVVQEEDTRFQRAIQNKSCKPSRHSSRSPSSNNRAGGRGGTAGGKRKARMEESEEGAPTSGNWSSAEVFRSETLRGDVKKRELAKLKRGSFSTEPIQSMRVPPVYEHMHRKSKSLLLFNRR